MAERGIDVLLVGEVANRRYLSGFAAQDDSPGLSAGWIVLTPDSGIFLTTFNYYEAVRERMTHLEPIRAEGRTLPALVERLKQTPGARIGFEGGWVTWEVYQALIEGLGPERQLASVDGLVEGLREVKNAAELAVIQRAVEITDRAFEDVAAQTRPGQTEREVAWAIERRLRELGAEGMAFGPTVAAGPNAAIPHHESSDRPIRAGEPVWIDLGARFEGYCGDLTRSFCLETASPEYLDLWHLVLEAEEKAIRELRPGMSGKEVDALARDFLTAAGQGEAFGHGSGHGIGLQIHEAPWLLTRIEAPIPSGSVVTIEPGIYRPGWGGIRHEDAVLVTPSGARVLSRAVKKSVW